MESRKLKVEIQLEKGHKLHIQECADPFTNEFLILICYVIILLWIHVTKFYSLFLSLSLSLSLSLNLSLSLFFVTIIFFFYYSFSIFYVTFTY